ncbi:MAG: M20/M25/M40 family metallo-hydrolase [Candidatus Hodarchaeota archaeon]
MENINFNNEIIELIRKSNDQFIENDLREFLKIASNSLNKEGILKAKDFIINYISDFCQDFQEIEGEVNPLILAKVKGNLKKNLLIYMMYDTQPITNEKDWIAPPFKAEIKTFPDDLSRLNDCIIARGAYNSKTPLICFLNVVKILKSMEKLPISLLLLFDGEEEIGSPTLLQLLESHKDLFKSCIDAYYPSTKQDLRGNSILKLGYKGILSLTFEAKSENKEPHSAFASLIPNPALDLLGLIHKIYSNYKFHIKSLSTPYIPTKEEQQLINKLYEFINIEDIKNKAGISHTFEKDPKKAFFNYLFNPSFNISTFNSGYWGKGIKNIVPNSAKCNIDIRFAHNILIDDLFREIEEIKSKYIKNSNSNIELTKNLGYEGSRVNLNSNLVKSLSKSFEILGIQTVIWPISAAAAPLSKIQKTSGLNFIVGGLGIGGFAHAPNEFIQVESILNTRLSNYYFLQIYSNSINKN